MSADGGTTFVAADPTLPAEPTRGGIAIDGRDIYLALSASGVFKSSDGGLTFSPASTGISDAPHYVDQIFVDPNRRSTLFAVSTFGLQLYRSDDSGATWQHQAFAVSNFVFDRSHPGVIYASGIDQTYSSADGGATWTPIAPSPVGFGAGGVAPLAVDSQGNVYTSQFDTLYASRDRGASWTRAQTFGTTRLLLTDPDASTVYALAGENLYASSDGFATYQTVESYKIAGISMLAVSRGTMFTAAPNLTSDAFIAKLDASGSLVWATYFGGPYDEWATGIAVAPNGDVLVCGSASVPPAAGGSFVARFSGDGQLRNANQFTDLWTASQSIAADAAGNAYVTGTTVATIAGSSGTLPVTPGAAQQTLLPPSGQSAESRVPLFIDPSDAFACKLDPAGMLVYCTYLGSGQHHGNTISVDRDGNAYVAGGGTVWKVNSAGSAILYTRDLPGGSIVTGAIDGHGSWLLGGNTAIPEFPTTSGAFQRTLDRGTTLPIASPLVANISSDGFVTQLNADTGDLIASTLLGGESQDTVEALAVGADGAVTVAGMTSSRTFPLRGAVQGAFAANTGFVTRLTGDLSTLVFSTYVGDTRNFAAFGVALADDSSVFVAGDTAYPWGTGPFAGAAVPPANLFVARLVPGPVSLPDVTAVLNAASQLGTRIAPNQIITVLAPGAAADAGVLLDGVPLPVLSSSLGSIVSQIPADYQAPGAVNLQVQSGDALSAPLLLPGAAAAPGIYTQDGSGQGLGLIFNEDGSLNTTANPAAQGSAVSIVCNGAGLATPLTVYISGFAANLLDEQVQPIAGLPGAALVLRVRIPGTDVTHFKMQPIVSVTVNAGGVSNVSGILSQAGVGIAIQQ